MASIRDLKKDVKYLVNHFINECYTQLAFTPELDSENILDIISDALELKRSILAKLSSKANHTDAKSKAHYTSIADEFYKRIIELTERLHSLEY